MKRSLSFTASYGSQILLYDDANVEAIGALVYDESAYLNGYTVADGAVAFFTIIEDGWARFSIWEGRPLDTAQYSKIAEAPVSLKSGALCIHEPEDPPVVLALSAGEYNVIFAQKTIEVEDFLEIDVFLERHL